MNEEKLFVVRITANAASHLHSTARWAKFLAILGFVSALFIVVAALFMMTMGTLIPFLPKGDLPSPAMPMGIMFIAALLYLSISVLVIVLSLQLYLFGHKTIQALKNNDDLTMEFAFKNLKRYYKISGIFSIAILSVYLIIIAFTITAGFMA